MRVRFLESYLSIYTSMPRKLFLRVRRCTRACPRCLRPRPHCPAHSCCAAPAHTIHSAHPHAPAASSDRRARSLKLHRACARTRSILENSPLQDAQPAVLHTPIASAHARTNAQLHAAQCPPMPTAAQPAKRARTQPCAPPCMLMPQGHSSGRRKAPHRLKRKL